LGSKLWIGERFSTKALVTKGNFLPLRKERNLGYERLNTFFFKDLGGQKFLGEGPPGKNAFENFLGV